MTLQKRSIALAISMATLAASTSQAQVASSSSDASILASGRMAKLDIAGIRLGMTPREAEDSLQQSGYKIDNRVTGSSYQQRVQIALRDRVPATPYVSSSSQQTPAYWSAYGPNREFLTVSFAPMPGGPRVKEVGVTFNMENTTIDTVTRQVAEKFGPSSKERRYDYSRFWCGQGDQTCGEIVGYTSPFLSYGYMFGNGKLRLTAEEPIGNWIKNSVSNEVDRRAPKGRSAF